MVIAAAATDPGEISRLEDEKTSFKQVVERHRHEAEKFISTTSKLQKVAEMSGQQSPSYTEGLHEQLKVRRDRL